MDSLEHMADLADFGRWNMAEYIPVEMHHATLPASFGQLLGGALREATAGIRNDQLHALEAALTQKRRPAGLVLLGALADAQNLPKTLELTGSVQNLSHI